METILFIGGPADGKRLRVTRGAHEWRIPGPPELGEMTHHHYTRRAFFARASTVDGRFSGVEMFVLAALTDLDALQHLVTFYRTP